MPVPINPQHVQTMRGSTSLVRSIEHQSMDDDRESSNRRGTLVVIAGVLKLERRRNPSAVETAVAVFFFCELGRPL
jgi:hypothetical protein